jgi:hypothetical protein
LVLSEPSTNAPDADILLNETKTGRRYTLLLAFPAGLQIQPGQALEAGGKSNDRESLVVKVPVVTFQLDHLCGWPHASPLVNKN